MGTPPPERRGLSGGGRALYPGGQPANGLAGREQRGRGDGGDGGHGGDGEEGAGQQIFLKWHNCTLLLVYIAIVVYQKSIFKATKN